MGGGPGSNGGGYFLHWRNQKFRFFHTRKFSKMLKIYENFIIFKIFQEILRFFESFFKSLTKFSRKCRENVESFGNIDL